MSSILFLEPSKSYMLPYSHFEFGEVVTDRITLRQLSLPRGPRMAMYAHVDSYLGRSRNGIHRRVGVADLPSIFIIPIFTACDLVQIDAH